MYIDEVIREQKQKLEASAPSGEPSNQLLTPGSSATTNSLRRALRSFFTKSPSDSTYQQTPGHVAPTPTPSGISLASDGATYHTKSLQDSSSPSETNLPWYQREFNLQPYGFDVVFEFGWDRKES